MTPARLLITPMWCANFIIFYMLHDVEEVREYCSVNEHLAELEFEPRCV